MRRRKLLLLLLWPALLACQSGESSDVAIVAQAGLVARPSSMAPVAFYAVGALPRAIAVADFNGDGRSDVAVANAGDGTVTVLFGDDTGQLGGSVTFPAGGEPSDVDAVDFDLDGTIDLIFANHETPSITVLLNDGRGGFAPAPRSPFDTEARPHIHGLAAGDYDGDGWVDVAVESSDTRAVHVLMGGANGLAPPTPVPLGTMPYSRLGVGDVTGDGRANILIPGHGDSTVLAIESVGGILRAAPWILRLRTQPWMVIAGDVDRDGRDDVVVVETNAVSVWLATDAGHVPAPNSPFSIIGATEAAVGDLDGDGYADIAVGPWDGDEVTVVFGRDATVRRVQMCMRPIGLEIADVTGDGRADLLVTCTHTNELAVLAVVPL